MIGRKLVNRYEIREHVGDGSTATVYRAIDEKLGRSVAIKMLLPHVRDTTRQRFMQEANAAAKLNHPNIMALYDVNEEGGRLFLVLEYVEGDSLSRYVPSAPEKVIDLGSQIAHALHYAHERGIIHRDIKPANIKVTPAGQVKLMDLGLALSKETQRVTAAGMVIGTPAYLSPEQAQGLTLDFRTDIYSLGIVLYEMVTGQLPFNADDIAALLLQQVKQDPPPPRLHNPAISAELERAIMKALKKEPVQRFSSAEALATALESCLNAGNIAPDVHYEPAPPSIPAQRAADTAQVARASEQKRGNRRTLRLILADDHVLLRKTLLSMLEQRDDMVVVAEAGDGESAVQQTLAILPDLLILDLNMPIRTGLEALPEIRSKAPQVKVLVLTGREEEAYIIRALRAGAHGYILKSADEGELFEAITKVMQGHLYLGRGVAEKMVTGILGDQADADVRLNEVELQILLYVAAGYENDAIARKMSVSIITVIESLAQAMNKLGAKDRHSTALKAIKRGFILLEDLHGLSEAD